MKIIDNLIFHTDFDIDRSGKKLIYDFSENDNDLIINRENGIEPIWSENNGSIQLKNTTLSINPFNINNNTLSLYLKIRFYNDNGNIISFNNNKNKLFGVYVENKELKIFIKDKLINTNFIYNYEKFYNIFVTFDFSNNKISLFNDNNLQIKSDITSYDLNINHIDINDTSNIISLQTIKMYNIIISDSDIYKLLFTSTFIDENKNIYTKSINNNNKSSISKNGINWNEFSIGNNLNISKDKLIVPSINIF